MKYNNLFDYPNNLQFIFDKLDKYRIKPIIIGGYIRDKFLNLESKDIDIELYGVSSFEKLEKLLDEFGEVNSVGKSFGVCKLSLKNQEIDFTLPRRDNKVSSGHCGFEIKVEKDLDFKTATSRRDFTINAIGFDTIEKKILDPFDGQKDIKNKILRAVNIKTFFEDPLRILRLVSFASRFKFTIEEELFLSSKKMCESKILEELASERIFSEIKKILLKSPEPSLGFKLLQKLNALEFFIPLNTLSQKDFLNTLHSLDILSVLKTTDEDTNIILMLSVLCYKFKTRDTIQFITHLTNNKNILKNVLQFLDTDFDIKYTNSGILKLATKVNIEDFLLLSQAIHFTTEIDIFYDLKNRAKSLGVLHKPLEAYLSGKDILALGIEPSQEYSNILALAYEKQLNFELDSFEQAKKWLEMYVKSL